jgi:Flp pilus assembly protein CpaB
LQAGEVLKPENLTLVEWPAKMPLEGAFTKIEEVSGRAVILSGSHAATGSRGIFGGGGLRNRSHGENP